MVLYEPFKLKINFYNDNIIHKTFFKKYDFMKFIYSLSNCNVELEYNNFIFFYVIKYKFDDYFPF